MIEELIASSTRAKILTLFFANPGNKFYVREIARKTNKNLNSVRRELEKLEGIGLLKSERVANLRYYSLNKRIPIYEELKIIFLKTEGLGDVIRENLNQLGKVDNAFIYGSFAKGEERLKSDIDLMIIGEVDQEKLALLIRELEDKLYREINYTVFTKEEFYERKKSQDPFIKNILKEKRIKMV